ncbi:MAG: hypothetical protein SGI99_03990 [Pseudomonadota bacterium]|nr:hypothetical protein [Pseudomonadota bacterium]
MTTPARNALRECVNKLVSDALDAAAPDQARVWKEGNDALFSAASDLDREWLRDRLQDASCRVGVASDSADSARLLAAEGKKHPEDDQPSDPPYPFIAYFKVTESAQGANVSLLDALARLELGGGLRTTTWGYSRDRGEAWIADARRGVTRQQLADSVLHMKNELAQLGLHAEFD